MNSTDFTAENPMTAISPSQLSIIAAFLEKSRDYLDIEHTIRLHWPRQAARGAAPQRKRAASSEFAAACHAGT
ncbi:MAG TPA: hypothetical protein PLE72_04095 [Azospira sp.]|nr:hypothetical protein [Azospira sp.]HNN08423.1 hypothetical protein [Azospira sp.]